jgi:hypothetical protein
MTIVVTAASVQERDGARLAFARINGAGKKLRRVWVDGGYRGPALASWVQARFRFVLQVVLRNEGQGGFVVLPRRDVPGGHDLRETPPPAPLRMRRVRETYSVAGRKFEVWDLPFV